MTTTQSVLDADLRTLHVRCGHDIQHTLREAGLHGDFGLHINPYLQGPVTQAADWLEQRARFIIASHTGTPSLEYATVLQACRAEEALLLSASRGDYQRVVLWFEHDCYDQFILLRCLALFEEHGMPPQLELICISGFTGVAPFYGLGQLSADNLRALWSQRVAVTRQQLAFARDAWYLFTLDDPRPLAALMLAGTPPLPLLAPALQRHLQELPAVRDGLGENQRLLLTTLARLGPVKVARLIGEVFAVRGTLSGLGDSGLDYELRQMEQVQPPVLQREQHGGMRHDNIVLTDAGHALLSQQHRWFTLNPPPRWVGGVCIKPGQRNWHWNADAQQPVLL